jgi:flap endonuclease-1
MKQKRDKWFDCICYRLINQMRQHSVKPIAIFDAPGPREWKALEHNKRTSMRSLNLARSLLEDERRGRLARMREIVLSGKETLMKGGLPTQEAEKDIEAALAKVETTSIQGEDQDEVREGERIVHETLRLMLACRKASRPAEKAKPLTALEFAEGKFRHDEEAADLEEQVENEIITAIPTPDNSSVVFPAVSVEIASTADAIDSQPADEDDQTEGLSSIAVPPTTEFTETTRQTILTTLEDYLLTDIYKSLISPETKPNDFDQLEQEAISLDERARLVARTYERSHLKPTRNDMNEAVVLLTRMGVPIVWAEAPYEAESIAAGMTIAGTADYAGTEDSDVLGWGGKLLRKVVSSKEGLEVIDGEDLKEALGFKAEGKEGETPRTGTSEGDRKFIDFIILNGTDSTERIRGIGFKKALKLIHSYPSIESILANGTLGKTKLLALINQGYLERVQAGRKVFGEIPPLPSPEELKEKVVPREEIDAFMRVVHGLETRLDPIADEEPSSQSEWTSETFKDDPLEVPDDWDKEVEGISQEVEQMMRRD